MSFYNQNIQKAPDMVKKQEELNSAIRSIQSCIDSYFENDGCNSYTELLKNLMSDFMIKAETNAKSEFDHIMVSERVTSAMDLMGFMAALYEKSVKIKEAQEKIKII